MKNDLETKIIKGAKKAHTQYYKMTYSNEIKDGWWLSHAPESFLQHHVAQAIIKADYCVYIDASMKKIRADMEVKRGRPTGKDSGKRPDITVWKKSESRVRAFIEIKRAWGIGPIKKDAKKITTLLKSEKSAKSGYILAYSEAKRGALINIFKRWEKQIEWKCIEPFVKPHDEKWEWGIALFRAPV